MVNAQNAEAIYVLKNENQKLKEKVKELDDECEARRRRDETSELGQLHERVNALLKENARLRETPDTQRFEEELVQVKLREAEAQLAIKDLQTTLHTLNLEYNEFLHNRQAVVSSLSPSSLASASANASISSSSSDQLKNGTSSSSACLDLQVLQEELLRVKMREAESVADFKSISLKMMQLDTEKQVAYNQIKRQDDEIRRLNALLVEHSEKALTCQQQLNEARRHLDNKEAELKESKMLHKLKEAELQHFVAELRQQVASLEVRFQEHVSTGQIQNSNSSAAAASAAHRTYSSSEKISQALEFSDDMSKFLLMSSQNSLPSTPSSVAASMLFLPLNSMNSSSNSNTINNSNSNSRSANQGKLLKRSQSNRSSVDSLVSPTVGKSQLSILRGVNSSTTNRIMEYLDSEDEDPFDVTLNTNNTNNNNNITTNTNGESTAKTT